MSLEVRKINITSAAHRIGTHSVVVTVSLCESACEVHALDHKTYEHWTTSLSLFHVAAMFAKESFTGGCKQFWDSIARSMELVEGDNIDEVTELPIMNEVIRAFVPAYSIFSHRAQFLRS